MTASRTRRRLLALLRTPVGLRQTLLATEVLQPPIALRQRRPGRPERPASQTTGDAPVDAHADADRRSPGDQ